MTWVLIKHLFPCFCFPFFSRTLGSIMHSQLHVLIEPSLKHSSFRPPQIHMWPWSVRFGVSGGWEHTQDTSVWGWHKCFEYCQANQTNCSRESLPLPRLFLSIGMLAHSFSKPSAETAWGHVTDAPARL